MYIRRTYDVAHGDVIGQADLLTDTHELAVSETQRNTSVRPVVTAVLLFCNYYITQRDSQRTVVEINPNICVLGDRKAVELSFSHESNTTAEPDEK